jgi:hypothetical protein
MLFRVSLPIGWMTALILFFLPWVDINCRSHDGHKNVRVLVSGAQLATGGATYESGDQTAVLFADPAQLTKDTRHLVAGYLLFAYAMGLTLAIWLSFRHLSSGRYTGRLFGLASFLLLLLVGASWFIMRWLFRPGSSSDALQEWVMEVRLTVWYYASYVANGYSLAASATDYWHHFTSNK